MLWDDLAPKWDRYRPPIIPDAADIAAYRRAIAGHDDHVLLLGVTPQLAGLGRELTAVDHSPRMVASIWPGDSATRRALCAEWLDGLPADGRFGAVISDGGLSCLRWPDDYRVLIGELHRACRPGFRLALRCHLAPAGDAGLSLADVGASLADGGPHDPHFARHRVAHALVLERGDPNIAVAEMAALARDFLRHDRAAFQVLDAWPPAGDQTHFSFPRRADLAALLDACGIALDPPAPDAANFLIGTAR